MASRSSSHLVPIQRRSQLTVSGSRRRFEELARGSRRSAEEFVEQSEDSKTNRPRTTGPAAASLLYDERTQISPDHASVLVAVVVAAIRSHLSHPEV